MLRRNLLIGGLVAGAFVLPSLAMAGVVAGTCSNCHTMHTSQNGISSGSGNPQLLTASGCVGCHANGDANLATGLGNGATGAPQVDSVAGAGFINAAGYFDAGGADANQHNPTDYVALGADALMLGDIPGSALAYAGNEVTCQGCHDSNGHHAGTGGYRLLGTAAGSPSLHNYGVSAGGGVFPANRSAMAYDAAVMNQVCADCHGTFHGAGNTNAVSPFIRHPTNLDMDTNTGNSIDNAAVYTDAVVVGTGNVVMCLSCHVAHGGPNADLLSFTYAGTNDAGNGTRGEGCETCHDYAGTGM